MRVHVKMFDKRIELTDVDPGESVRSLMVRIRDATGVQLEQQRLVLPSSSEPLVDEWKRLDECGLVKGDTALVYLKLNLFKTRASNESTKLHYKKQPTAPPQRYDNVIFEHESTFNKWQP